MSRNNGNIAEVMARQDLRDQAAAEIKRQDRSKFSVAAPTMAPPTKVERRQMRQAEVLLLGTRRERDRGAAMLRKIARERQERNDLRQVQAGLAETVGAEMLKAGGDVEAYNGVGAIRMKSRDGLANLYEAGKLTKAEWLTGYAFRQLLEGQTADLRSQLGRVGEGGGGRRSTDGMIIKGLMAAAGSTALAKVGEAIYLATHGDPGRRGGREMKALIWIAGEGRCIDSFAKGGAMHAVWVAALLRALHAAAPFLPAVHLVEGS